MLAQGGTGARESLMEQQRVLVDEAQGDEFGEASGLVLDVAQQQHLANPVVRSFSMAVHHRGGGADAGAVRGADDLDPLRGRQLVGGEDVANLVVENFGGGARKRAQTVVAQHGEILGERHAGEFDAVDDLHGRESVDVHARNGALHGAENVAIIKRRQAVRQTALNADLGGSELPGLHGFLRDLVRLEEIGVRLARAAAEGAEFASHEADVGEIDVAVDYVSDEISDKFGAQKIRGYEQAEEIVSVGVGEREALFQGKRGAILRFENSIERGAGGIGKSRRDVRPVERGKAFEFRMRKFAGHETLHRDLAG